SSTSRRSSAACCADTSAFRTMARESDSARTRSRSASWLAAASSSGVMVPGVHDRRPGGSVPPAAGPGIRPGDLRSTKTSANRAATSPIASTSAIPLLTARPFPLKGSVAPPSGATRVPCSEGYCAPADHCQGRPIPPPTSAQAGQPVQNLQSQHVRGPPPRYRLGRRSRTVVSRQPGQLNSGQLNSGQLNSGQLNSGQLNSGQLKSGPIFRPGERRLGSGPVLRPGGAPPGKTWLGGPGIGSCLAPGLVKLARELLNSARPTSGEPSCRPSCGRYGIPLRPLGRLDRL